MKYTVKVTQEPDGGFVAKVPALPACVSRGDTVEEAVSNLREVIILYLNDLGDGGEAGDPVPV